MDKVVDSRKEVKIKKTKKKREKEDKFCFGTWTFATRSHIVAVGV